MAIVPSRRAMTIKVLVVDDHASYGESVARALSAESDLEVSFCTSIAAALKRLEQDPADIVLLDHDLGIERASQFLPTAWRVGFAGRVLVVTGWVSDIEAKRLWRQGVAGIFLKDRALDELVEGIRVIQRGGECFDQRYRHIVDNDLIEKQSDVGPLFNERQRRVLRFVLEGLSNKQIAERLQFSESYVKALIQALFRKTGVRTRGQLVRVALEHYQDQF
jgi:two-component system, NarL family, nitrate/nitrite response regulator NarL